MRPWRSASVPWARRDRSLLAFTPPPPEFAGALLGGALLAEPSELGGACLSVLGVVERDALVCRSEPLSSRPRNQAPAPTEAAPAPALAHFNRSRRETRFGMVMLLRPKRIRDSTPQVRAERWNVRAGLRWPAQQPRGSESPDCSDPGHHFVAIGAHCRGGQDVVSSPCNQQIIEQLKYNHTYLELQNFYRQIGQFSTNYFKHSRK